MAISDISENVTKAFQNLIKELKIQGWNDDIIDDTKILLRRYKKDKENL